MALVFYYLRDFFAFLFDFFKTIVEFFNSLIDVLGSGLTFFANVFTAMPAVFLVPFFGLIAISILYKILGRESQS